MIYPENPVDRRALARLAPRIRDALEAQDPSVRDELDAAIARGEIAFTAEDDVLVGPCVVVVVDGYPLCSLALADLVEDDSPFDEVPLSDEVERWLREQ